MTREVLVDQNDFHIIRCPIVGVVYVKLCVCHKAIEMSIKKSLSLHHQLFEDTNVPTLSGSFVRS